MRIFEQCFTHKSMAVAEEGEILNAYFSWVSISKEALEQVLMQVSESKRSIFLADFTSFYEQYRSNPNKILVECVESIEREYERREITKLSLHVDGDNETDWVYYGSRLYYKRREDMHRMMHDQTEKDFEEENKWEIKWGIDETDIEDEAKGFSNIAIWDNRERVFDIIDAIREQIAENAEIIELFTEKIRYGIETESLRKDPNNLGCLATSHFAWCLAKAHGERKSDNQFRKDYSILEFYTTTPQGKRHNKITLHSAYKKTQERPKTLSEKDEKRIVSAITYKLSVLKTQP